VTSDNPLVSAVVPAFNAEATLAQTLASVAQQTWRNLEILIVDDGSTDATREIAETFCNREPRARLIRQPNGGVARARNRGIEEAKGEWVAPIDADDLWHTNKIAEQVRAARGSPTGTAMLFCWSHLIDASDRVLGSGLGLAAGPDAFGQLAYLNLVGNGSALLLLRSAVRAIGGYDPRLHDAGLQGCEDFLLQLRMAHRHPVVTVHQYLVGYRLGGPSMSNDFDRMARSWQLAVQLLEQEGVRLDPTLLRWARGVNALDHAQSHWTAGRWREGATALAQALASDPKRTGRYLLARSLQLRLPQRSFSPSSAVPFGESDPRRSYRDPDHALPWLTKLDLERLRRLGSDTPSR